MPERQPLPDLADDDVVCFLDAHRPALPADDYTLAVSHDLAADSHARSFAATLRFSVAGERLGLGDDLVFAVYPPNGADGKFAGQLPHVVLARSTLPWERSAAAPAGPVTAPWLAILLLRVTEAPEPRTCPLRAVRERLHLHLEAAQHDDDPVRVLELPRAQLQRLLPRQTELGLLAHVRKTTRRGEADAKFSEQATVIGNRVIAADTDYVAHLVSLEGRYPELLAPADEPTVALVSLYSWRFHSSDAVGDLAGVLTALDTAGGSAAAHLPVTADLPPAARPLVLQGYTPLPHALRTGDRTLSWYRGPLLPRAPRAAAAPVPARSADALLRLDAATGCLDASFAAAWQLGRLLALADPHYAVELVHWKQATRLALAAGAPAPTVPDVVRLWIDRLTHLESVPFAYLVPDERLLPVESIRFFTLDPDWTACLLDGAFSPGRILRGDQLRDEALMETAVPTRRLGGLLLRSAAVRGWPGLEIDAWHDRGAALAEPAPAAAHLPADRFTRLACVRKQRLGPDVLLCLFDGGDERLDPDVFELHLHPQSMHFGFEPDAQRLVKRLRDPRDGSTVAGEPIAPTIDATTGVVQIAPLFAELTRRHTAAGWEACTTGDLAFQLLDAPPLVRFVRPDAAGVHIVEGIGPVHAHALAAAGILTLTDLRGLLARPETTWPKVHGVTPKRLRAWAYHADLLRIPGVDEHQAELLADVGVLGVADLATRDPADLQPRLAAANAQRRRAPRVPGPNLLAAWISAAGSLAQEVRR